ERNVAMLFISHDLAVVRSLADRIAVLFRGEVLSVGPVGDIFSPPHHPYTLSLLEAVSRIDMVRKSNVKPVARLLGEDIRPKCPYAGRCAFQIGRICVEKEPP